MADYSFAMANAARILLIDDNDVFRKMARVALVTEGYEVHEATDGKAGLVHYREQPSDLVITDIVMPEQEGLETIRQLRRFHPQVRIIAMSGTDPDTVGGYLQIALTFGARGILHKPFTLDELLAAVSGALAS